VLGKGSEPLEELPGYACRLLDFTCASFNFAGHGRRGGHHSGLAVGNIGELLRVFCQHIDEAEVGGYAGSSAVRVVAFGRRVEIGFKSWRLEIPVDHDDAEVLLEKTLRQVRQGHGTAYTALIGIQGVNHVVPVVCLASALRTVKSSQAMRLRTIRSMSEMRCTFSAHLANSPMRGGMAGSK